MADIKDIELVDEGKYHKVNAFKVTINDNVLFGFFDFDIDKKAKLNYETSLNGLIRNKDYLGKDFSKLNGELKVKLQPQTKAQLTTAIQEYLEHIKKSREATVTL